MAVLTRNRYKSGRAKEYAAIAELKRRGATLVVRSAGSKGLADLVAVFGATIWLVQVKSTSTGRWEDANWRKLKALERPFNVWPMAMVFNRGVRRPTVIDVIGSDRHT